ncbi:Pleckstrin homology domain-containing protein [Mycena floridula]|nr:Pleckstrin homology domain-containing protein [Mycena floridula]
MSEPVKAKPDHNYQRFFIGPMPERLVSTSKAQARNKNKRRRFPFGGSNDENDDDETRMLAAMKRHALDVFLHRGGEADAWDDEEERHLVKELYNSWRAKSPEARQARWVGSSFVVGDVMGVDTFENPPPQALSTRSNAVSAVSLPLSTNAPTNSNQSQASGSRRLDAPGTSILRRSASFLTVPWTNSSPSPSDSSSPLIRVQSEAPSEPHMGLDDGGRRRLVHYADTPVRSPPGSRPVSPTEVLEREGDAVEATSAGAMSSPLGNRVIDRQCMDGDRNASYKDFDEAQHRTARGLTMEDWGEYIVVWRKDRIELYKDYRLPGKEWILGHKDLAFVIPLTPRKSRLSLYSFVDLTFCITCPPTSTGAAITRHFHHSEGTNIFIFKHKCRSRAFDWIWKLWSHLGGELPNNLDIWNPAMGIKVKMDVPELDPDELYPIFNRENLIALCLQSLRSVEDYKYLIEHQLAEGKVLQLAWRMDTVLDWIWLDDDIYGEARRWAVLCGLALKKSRSIQLELRMGSHFPTSVLLKDDTRLHQPLEVEGYVDRIKPKSQAKQAMYMATHQGNLFVINPAKAFPPAPFGLEPLEPADPEITPQEAEIQRGISQIMAATFYADLRSIVAIRRAFQVTLQRTHNERIPEQDNASGSWVSVWSRSDERIESDDEDEGGDEALLKTADKPKLRMRRSFELLFTNGYVVRFEVHSRKLAVEWIEKLRALIVYWSHRHRIDAREQMDVAQSRRPRLTPHTHIHPSDEVPETPSDPSAPMPALGTLFNMCIIQGCRPVVKGGKLHMRKGLHGAYGLVQMLLVHGHILFFTIGPNVPMHKSAGKAISLVDAYTCSGYLAAQLLPGGQYNPNSTPMARRYQDGLETDDPEEDTLFTVSYRTQTVSSNVSVSTTQPPQSIPSLSTKRIIFFRTRSKLERDAWCWALNCEIERVARKHQEREKTLRDTGAVVNTR